MIRRIAFTKAVFAGAVGALAWEGVARLIHLTGVRVFDIVWVLGTLTPTLNSQWKWWPIGIAVHLGIGAIWAIFYAFFFWETLRLPRWAQGMIFAIGPALLAGVVVVPELGSIHQAINELAPANPGIFAWRLGWSAPFTIILGHAVYGFVLGLLYVRPVGAPAGKPPHWKHSPVGARQWDHPMPPAPNGNFMFATGIECSYPTIDHGRWRMDELQLTNHYRYWRRDIELVRESGLRYLRYGPPFYRIMLGPGRYDWAFTDAVCGAMRELGVTPIMDLCHFGVPQWLGNFQNPEFPHALAEYARAFAQRYPWVRFYTPVNEMYVTARMSTLDGAWNEQMQSEDGYVRAQLNIVKAAMLVMEAIQKIQPRAVFIVSESSEFYQACCPDDAIIRKADFENQRRFIALDFLYQAKMQPQIEQHLRNHGMTDAEHAWLRNQPPAGRCVMGIDYYAWNEKVIDVHLQPESLGELFGWYVITQQYYERYHRPIMHTETNCPDAKQAPGWIWRQWHNVQMIRRANVPVVGFTWYSLQDQVDWDSGLTLSRGNVNPVGLYDLNRDEREVGQAYRHLVRLFRNEPLPDIPWLKEAITS